MVSSGSVRSFIPRSGTLSCLLGVLAFLLSSPGPDSIATIPLHEVSLHLDIESPFLAALPETEESPIPESVKAQLSLNSYLIRPLLVFELVIKGRLHWYPFGMRCEHFHF